MSIKSDRWIRRQAEAGMIEPFEAGQVRTANGGRIVSYGTSSYGYDVRCADEFKIFTNINSTIVDPKNFDEGSFVDFKGDVCIIPPTCAGAHRRVFPHSAQCADHLPGQEHLRALRHHRQRDAAGAGMGRPRHAGISNTTPLPAKIYAGEGCAQMLFLESDEVCETSYRDRGGKYQGQRGVTLPERRGPRSAARFLPGAPAADRRSRIRAAPIGAVLLGCGVDLRWIFLSPYFALSVAEGGRHCVAAKPPSRGLEALAPVFACAGRRYSMSHSLSSIWTKPWRW